MKRPEHECIDFEVVYFHKNDRVMSLRRCLVCDRMRTKDHAPLVAVGGPGNPDVAKHYPAAGNVMLSNNDGSARAWKRGRA